MAHPAERAVIRIGGRDWGTAGEIARALGSDITPAMVRRWAERDSLQAIHVPGPGRGVVRYRVEPSTNNGCGARESQATASP